MQKEEGGQKRTDDRLQTIDHRKRMTEDSA